MKLKNIVIKILILVAVIVISNAAANFLGAWLKDNYAIYNYGSFFWGLNNPEVVDGWLLGYVFFSSLLFPLYTKKIISGFYWALPALLLLLLSGSLNPQLWLSLLLLAAGLGLAYLILLLTRKLAR